MRQDRKQKDKPAIALVLCFCLIAIVSILIVKANIDKVKDNMESAKVSDVVKEKAVDENKEETSPSIVDSRDNNQSDDASSAAEFIVPLKGEIIMEYSMDMPIYWETLDQYMTHGGVDISSPAGTEVRACASGTVTRVEEDDKFGITAEINHGNGIISVYSNLSKTGLIELGEIVSQGDVIGEVGQSAMFEFESPEHLHFEIRKDEQQVNPADYIKELK